MVFLRPTLSITSKLLYRRQMQTVPKRSRNPLKRAAHYLRNDPFARVSIMFGGTVLIILLIVESFVPKPQKRIKPQLALYPPKSTHSVIQRHNELDVMTSWIPSFYTYNGPSVAMVTGPSGCGKTELLYQFAHKFIEYCNPIVFTKPSKKPIVLYLDCSTVDTLNLSASNCAHILGIMNSNIPSDVATPTNGLLDSVLSKLSTQKAKWLLIVDNVSTGTAHFVNESLKQLKGYKCRRGMVVMSSVNGADVYTDNVLSLPSSLPRDEGVKLLSLLTNIPYDALSEHKDTSTITKASPLQLAMSGLTIRAYNHFYDSPSDVLSKYADLLNTSLPLQLYMEAMTACETSFNFIIEFLGSCDHAHPIPFSVIKQHLKNPFYKSLPSKSFLATDETIKQMEPHPQDLPRPQNITNYLSMVKNNLPIIGGGGAPDETYPQQQQQLLNNSMDDSTTIIPTPFLRISSLIGYDIQLVHVHQSASEVIRKCFMEYSLEHLEEMELVRAKTQWERSAWLKRFRSFDPEHSISSFLSSLPGIKEGGAYTEQQYSSLKEENSLTYSQYLHMTSHLHRLATTIKNELIYFRGKDYEDMFTKKCLLPHVHYMLNTCKDDLLDNDSLSFETSLLNIQTMLAKVTLTDTILQYETLLTAHVKLYGQQHINTANVLTTLGELYYHNQEYTKALALLNQANDIHDSTDVRLKSQEDAVQHASCLSSIGFVYSGLGDKEKCVQYLEKSLMLYQAIPSDGDITKSQRKLVATTVTDLGHAYIMMGDVNSAKRYLDLAIIAQRGIHGNDHAEVARTLNVQSIMYTLIGNNSESNNIRREVGDIQKELSLISDVI